jgi:hypothetical protein
LGDKKLTFDTFKKIYGHSEEKGVRRIKVGGSTLLVDNQNYTYTVAPAHEK